MKSTETFKAAFRKEGLRAACLRTLKVTARSIDRFLRAVPCMLVSLQKEKVTVVVNGYKMNLYLKDKGIARELYVHHKREYVATDLMLSGAVVKEGDVVLDLGANIGYYALMESELVGQTGSVYAVEPSPVNYKVLQENIELNGFENIQTFNLAMGETNGKAEMFISDRSNWSRLVDKDLNDNINETVTVNISTVDEFIKDRPLPTMIRMDVEGYEIKILRGMKQWLKNDNLSLFVEFHPYFMTPEENMEFFDILEENGFQLSKCLLNPCLEQNFAVKFAYDKLGELDNYTGVIWEMSISEAREWVQTHDIKRLPHFLFTKNCS